MSIENSEMIDGLGLSKLDGKAVLTIADHLDWQDLDTHVELLERKIGSYLNFIRSGQLFEELPLAKGAAVRIELIQQYEPSAEALSILKAAKHQLEAGGLELTFYMLPEGY